MLVEVWSDIVCPWCYIGKRRLERALEMFPEREAVTVRYRSFELDPSRARSTGDTLDQMLASKYGVPLEQARAMNARVTAIAATEGIPFQLEIARPGNTFDAHRLTHLARGSGLEAAAVERFQAAYFTEGADIGDHEVLAALSAEVGMDADTARATLAGDRFADSVREDEGLAAHLGIRGVPFFVLDRRLGVSGAQDAGVLLGALEQALRDAGTTKVVSPS